jgi:uncharacterized protein (TIGR00730 family)
MKDDAGAPARPPGRSICLFCGSSEAADPDFLAAAAAFGRLLAAEGVRLVSGGGGIGLMGAAAKAAHGAGGRVLGVMPEFLRRREVIYDAVETVVVKTMHERKRIMFEQSDAFAVFPGGVGTLEEVVELLSWRRLALHHKPIVFLDQKGFWAPFFALMRHTVEQRLTPPWVPDTWQAAATPQAVLAAIRREWETPTPAGDDTEVAGKL